MDMMWLLAGAVLLLAVVNSLATVLVLIFTLKGKQDLILENRMLLDRVMAVDHETFHKARAEISALRLKAHIAASPEESRRMQRAGM